VVRGGAQVRVVGFGQAGPLALAPAVDADVMEELAWPAGLKAGHACDGQPPAVA
jgi:hypothetical protein